MVQACNGTESLPLVFSSLIGRYAQKGLHFDCLKVFRNVIQHGFVPKVGCCNVVLDGLEHENEFRLALSFYGWMIRNGVLIDSNTSSVVARILCKNGKFDRVMRLLDSGIYNSTIFNLVIDSCSKCGNFEAAFDRLKEMCDRKIEPGFSTYSSVLDGACEVGNLELIEMVMHIMSKKKLMPVPLSSEYDDVIRKFSDLGKTYAAGMLFKRAEVEGVILKGTTLGCLLRAFSEGRRVKEAMSLYSMILQKGVVLGKSSYQAFADVLCQENPSEEVNKILIDLIRKGVSPCASEILKFMTLHCRNSRWQEAEDLLNVILEQGFLPDSSCCHSLVKHYCCCGHIESAISLHRKLEKLGAVLDVKAYNQLLRGLFAVKRVEEAVKLFDYMRSKNVVSSGSFLVMISGLCNEKEMRRAMQVHDEMLKMGLKPSRKTYKSLITVFR
ncbi:hypothetical protein Ancab_033533 [Ancistrocladus abbreviatus]